MSAESETGSITERTEVCHCAECGRVFPVVPSRVERTKYCSWACKNAALDQKVLHHCEYPPCPHTFWAKPSAKRRYCSQECFYNDISTPIKPLPMEELERTRIEALVLQYRPLVLSVAKRLCLELNPRHMLFDDFIQEGMFGLLTAIQNDTDASQKERFPGFAKYHITMAILFSYRTQEHTIRLPESLFRHDANVTLEQLDAFKGVSRCVPMHVLEAQECSREYGHEDTLKRLGGFFQTYSSLYQISSSSNTFEEDLLKKERIDELYHALMKLPTQQRRMIAEHYGLSCDATAMLQLCYKYKIARTSMHRLIHRGLDVLKGTLSR